MLGSLGAMVGGAALPARAEIFSPFGAMPQTFDPVAVAREQLARHGHNIALTDRVGVVDFGQPSRAPRFALVDMIKGAVQYFPVTHGRGSDPEHDGWLKNFSNRIGSLATSRGAYRTADYYWGANGSSMRLHGLEYDNSNALARAIVVHGAWYAEPTLISEQGKLGRSEGCFVFGADLLPEIMYKLGPGRLLVADRYSAPAVPPPAPLDQSNVVLAASGLTLP
ncbi:MAG: murein L,D-transpeptidase catalytic domain family protein [Sphingopyxis sp.]|nr:murein L,D-transpeptidase catalytic domain family protein [Sphingopyxis sp.]